MSIAPGNKKVFPSPAPNSSEARVNDIISRTQSQMFGGTTIDNPATTHGGGEWNSIAAMETIDGKELQESYRSGFSRSAEGHDKVSDR